MRISCPKDLILDKLQTSLKTVATKTTVPVLSGIRMETKGKDTVELASTDMELSLRLSLNVVVEREGAAVLPGRLVTDIVRSMPVGDVKIDFNEKEQMAEITCSSADFKINCLPADDFPRLPSMPAEGAFELEAGPMIETVNTVARAASRDETRPVLTGVLVKFSQDKIKMVATDSYRLSVRETEVKSTVTEKKEVIVPRASLEELARLCGAGDADEVDAGADGFVGRALCAALAAAGDDVSASVRNPEAAAGLTGVRVRITGDVGPETDWTEALGGVEAVVHLAARVHVMKEAAADPAAEYARVNAAGTRRLAEQAAAAGARRLVLMSTVKVNGEATMGEPFREGDPPAPADAYGRSKWEAERALPEVARQTGLEWVVLRPPLVYGPRVRGNFLSLMRLCRAAPPLPLAAIANRRSLVYVGNLVDAVRRCLTHPEAAGNTYLVGDGEDVSTPELIRLLAAAMGRPARLFPVPAALLRTVGAITGKSTAVARLLDSLVLDGGRIRRHLGWTPPFTMNRGLGETAAWFARQP